MTKLIGIAGSLRQGSYNAALLRAAADLMPTESEIEIVSIKDIPLYNGDIESNEGIPSTVELIKTKIANCDGVLLATPEYNHSVPGVMKNVIDWVSRPPEDVPKIFRNRPITVMGASPGHFGTMLAQEAWSTIFRALGTKPWFGNKVLVSHANNVFDANGRLIDEKVKEQLKKFVEGFVAFIKNE